MSETVSGGVCGCASSVRNMTPTLPGLDRSDGEGRQFVSVQSDAHAVSHPVERATGSTASLYRSPEVS